MSSTDDPDTDPNSDPDAWLSRRDFVKVAAGIGAVAAGSTASVNLDTTDLWTDDEAHYVGDDDGDYGAEDVLYTTCGQCNTFCPIKVRLADGSDAGEYSSLVRKLAGNPYSFLNTQPFAQVPYESDIEEIARITQRSERCLYSIRGGYTRWPRWETLMALLPALGLEMIVYKARETLH